MTFKHIHNTNDYRQIIECSMCDNDNFVYTWGKELCFVTILNFAGYLNHDR